jgi:prevent-host-death family protein
MADRKRKPIDDDVDSRTIGVRELRASLSSHLRRVRAGASLTVTDHGEPIAVLVPATMPEDLRKLLSTPGISWSGRKPKLPPLGPPLRGPGPTLSEMVRIMRDERDDAIAAAAGLPPRESE